MGGDIHVLPIRDLREHEETRHCWCRPRVEEGDVDADKQCRNNAIVIHSSEDGRELVEQHGLQ